ncbi:MAG: efflux RND transporter permease subunit [Candidatus Omnitrophota bacterium]
MEKDIKQKNNNQQYLDQLNFDPELKKGWMNFFVSNFRIIFLIILFLFGAGAYAFMELPRESYPELEIPIAVVTTVMPGASPEDVEELVTKKIESKISSLKDLDEVTSSSSNSISRITVTFDADADLSESMRNLRDEVGSVSNLPEAANESIVTEISLDDQPILQVAITGPYDGFAMYKYAETLKDELEKIPDVREVNISGGDEKEYKVSYYPDRLLAQGITASRANAAIIATNNTIPSGTFDSEKFQYSIRTDSRVYSVEDIAAIPVSNSADGSMITIGDLADVSVSTIKKTTLARISSDGSEAQEAITLSVLKRTGSSILDVVDQAKEAIEATVKTFNPGVEYTITKDSAKSVNKNFDQLEKDFLLTFLLVVGVLLLIVGPKEAMIAGISIPLVFLGTFFVFLNLGISLNTISFYSLILALGLLIDDAIVIVSATKQYLGTGKFTPEEAVLLVLKDFKVVLTTTTLVTIWAFLPLAFSPGVMGEFIRPLPVTLSVTLAFSFLIALTINAPLSAIFERIHINKKIFYLLEGLMISIVALLVFWGGWINCVIAAIIFIVIVLSSRWYERGGKGTLEDNEKLSKQESENDQLIKERLGRRSNENVSDLKGRITRGVLRLDALLPIYERYLRKLLSTKKNRTITLVVVIAALLFSISLPLSGVVQNEFFPVVDSNYIYIDVVSPAGTTLSETDKYVQQIEQKLLKYEEIAEFTSIAGGVSYQSQNTAASNTAVISITLKDKEQRELKSYQLTDKIREDLNSIKGVKMEISSTSELGLSSGAAFQVQISGNDLSVLNKIANDLQKELVQITGVIDPNISLKDSVPQYTFKLDPVKLAQNNLTSTEVGSVLRMALTGTEISNIVEENKEIKIIATFTSESLPDLNSIQNLQVVNSLGKPVFLKDLAIIELIPSVNKIEHLDQKRIVYLTANVNTQTNSNVVLTDFNKRIANYELPQGYTVAYGGENKQYQEAALSIVYAMVVAVLLIAITLVVQFNSFRKTFIVLATIPLALIGVFIGMATFGVTLSFPGLIGILALFGIVVKNAIILVDKISLNLRNGISFVDSIVDAGKSRLEAIFITSTCTIFGLLPITLSNDTWVSLGSAIIFGLLLSSLLTLFIVPILFFMIVPENTKQSR